MEPIQDDHRVRPNHIKIMRRRHCRRNRLVCLLIGHRYVYGVATVPDMHIWDCRWCPHSETRGTVR
jgi:hypothetical protein